MYPMISAANGSSTRVQPRVVIAHAVPPSSGEGARPDSRLNRDISKYSPTPSISRDSPGATSALNQWVPGFCMKKRITAKLTKNSTNMMAIAVIALIQKKRFMIGSSF